MPAGSQAFGTRRRSVASGGNGLLLTILAIGVFATYLVIERGQMASWDGRAMASVGQSIWLHGSVVECCHAFHAFPRDHLKYSKFGIGTSLVLAPLWGLQLHTNPNGAVWLGIANPLLLVGTTVVIAKTCLALGWRRSTAVMSALAFALLTMAPMYSTEFFAEPGVTFGSALALYGFVVFPHRETRGAILVGLGVAIAAVFRADSLLLVAPIVGLLVLYGRFRERVASWYRWFFGLTVPIAAAIVWTLEYNRIRFGSARSFGYNGPYDTRGFSTPLLHGAGVLLLSPGKSFFVYSPILLAALPGLWFLARSHWQVAGAVVLLCAVRVCFVSRWWTPEGGSGWGPRFLVPLCALLAIPLGASIERIRRAGPVGRAAGIVGIGFLGAASAVVAFASVAVPYKAVYDHINQLSSIPAPLRHAVADQRFHELKWSLSHTHLVFNLQHVRSAHWASLYWFRDGPSVFGVALLLLAIVGCAVALRLGFVLDGRPYRPPTLPRHE